MAPKIIAISYPDGGLRVITLPSSGSDAPLTADEKLLLAMHVEIERLKGEVKVLDGQIRGWRQSSNRHLSKLIKIKGEHRVCVEQLVLACNGTVEAEQERGKYKAALEKIAKERIPHPTPCRETYLRSVAKEALTVDEVRP